MYEVERMLCVEDVYVLYESLIVVGIAERRWNNDEQGTSHLNGRHQFRVVIIICYRERRTM